MNKTTSTAIFALLAFALIGGIFTSTTTDVFADGDKDKDKDADKDKEKKSENNGPGCMFGDDAAWVFQNQEQNVDQENELNVLQIGATTLSVLDGGDVDQDVNANLENDNAQAQDADVDQSEACLDN